MTKAIAGFFRIITDRFQETLTHSKEKTMGHYTAVYIDFTVRNDAPEPLRNYLNAVFQNNSESENLPTFPFTQDEVDDFAARYGVSSVKIEPSEEYGTSFDLYYHSHFVSGYHGAWAKRFHTVSEDTTRYQSFASLKSPDSETMALFFDMIQQYMVLTEGQIVFREIYEDSCEEYVVFFTEKNVGSPCKFIIAKGYVWPYNHNAPFSYEGHPWNSEEGEEPSMNRPTNFFEMYPSVKIENCKVIPVFPEHGTAYKKEEVGLSDEYIQAATDRFMKSHQVPKQDALSVELNNASAVMSTLDRLRAAGTFNNYKKGKKK